MPAATSGNRSPPVLRPSKKPLPSSLSQSIPPLGGQRRMRWRSSLRCLLFQNKPPLRRSPLFPVGSLVVAGKYPNRIHDFRLACFFISVSLPLIARVEPHKLSSAFAADQGKHQYQIRFSRLFPPEASSFSKQDNRVSRSAVFSFDLQAGIHGTGQQPYAKGCKGLLHRGSSFVFLRRACETPRQPSNERADQGGKIECQNADIFYPSAR